MDKNSENKKAICAFLKKCGTYYLATVDGEGKPRVRPFGTIDLFETDEGYTALTIQTGKIKDVSKQIHQNPDVEICAFDGEKWIRIQARAIELDSVAAKKHMLDAYPSLRGMYDENDGNTEIFRLTDGTATISSFTSPKEELQFA